jgi:unsaturated rhamnogalacturonyl hydrolase
MGLGGPILALLAALGVSACGSGDDPSGRPDVGNPNPGHPESDAASASDALGDHAVIPHPEAGATEDTGSPGVHPELEPEAGGGPDARADGSPANAEGGSDGGAGVLNPDVVAIMRKVADWQLPLAGGSKDWVHGAMWAGIMATYTTTKDPKYLQAIKNWAGAGWTLTGGAAARGDNQCAAQTFFDVYLQDPASMNMTTLSGAQPSFDALANNPPRGRVEWWWEDSLFMVPPSFARLGVITGNAKYVTAMNAMWWDSYAFLYSPQYNLMYRDQSFFGSTTFWSRGNGWVVAGIARVLQYLPADDPKRPDFIRVMNAMLTAMRPLQHADGLWPSDLLNGATGGPETSGTGFIAFAMTWGINNGVVDRATYLPIVQKAWKGLTSHVDAAGKLGYVQNIGAAPAPATVDETHEYGIGAFLLTGSEMAKLAP